jgi:hypothetical protein
VGHDDVDRSLQDEIDALLRQADPSPEFRTKVLQRIDMESTLPTGYGWFTLAAVVVASFALVTLIWFVSLRTPAADEPPLVTGLATVPTLRPDPPPLIPIGSPPQRDQRVSSRTTVSAPGTPDVLISPEDAAAFDAFVSIVKEGRLSADMFPPSDDGRTSTIEPLRVEPLAAIPSLQEAEL